MVVAIGLYLEAAGGFDCIVGCGWCMLEERNGVRSDGGIEL